MESKCGSISNPQNIGKNSAFSTLQSKDSVNMMVKIPKRQAAQKSSILGYNECETCRKIESQEYLLQCKRTKNNENSTIIRQEEEKLRKLKNHICTNNDANSDEFNDEEFNLIGSSRGVSKIRKCIRKRTGNANDCSASQYDSKDKNYTCSSKKIISVHEDTYQSHFEQITHKEPKMNSIQRPENSNKYSAEKISYTHDNKNKFEDSRYGLDQESQRSGNVSNKSKYLHQTPQIKTEEKEENLCEEILNDSDSAFEDAEEDDCKKKSIIKDPVKEKQITNDKNLGLLKPSFNREETNKKLENKRKDVERIKPDFQINEAQISNSNNKSSAIKSDNIPQNLNKREEKSIRVQGIEYQKMGNEIKHIEQQPQFREPPPVYNQNRCNFEENKSYVCNYQRPVENNYSSNYMNIIQPQSYTQNHMYMNNDNQWNRSLERLPSLSNRLNLETRNMQMNDNYNCFKTPYFQQPTVTPMNDRTSINICSEVPSFQFNPFNNCNNQHNYPQYNSYSRDMTYTPPSMCNRVNFRNPVYITTRPVSVISSVPNSGMNYYLCGNNMLVKGLSNQQVIQIPVSQLSFVTQPQSSTYNPY